MTPWLSVILPVHRGADLIGATLESVVAEQPEGVEFLAFDSGKDGGAARRVAERFTDLIDLSWTEMPEVASWTAKTNQGVRLARATHVAMLHQDDLWLPGHLPALRNVIEQRPDAVLSVGPSRFIAPDGRPLGHWRLPFSAGAMSGKDFAATLLVQNSIAIPSPLILRDAWLACGGLDDELWYTADWDLYLKLAESGEVVVRPRETTAFRIHGGSLTMTGSRDSAAFRRQHEIVIERHLNVLKPSAPALEKRARASVSMNCALASVAAGKCGGLLRAALELLALGPAGMVRYLTQSRLADRLGSRLRLKLAGEI